MSDFSTFLFLLEYERFSLWQKSSRFDKFEGSCCKYKWINTYIDIYILLLLLLLENTFALFIHISISIKNNYLLWNEICKKEITMVNIIITLCLYFIENFCIFVLNAILKTRWAKNILSLIILF